MAVLAQGFRSSTALDEIATSRGATPRQIAVAFLIRREGIFAIPKSSVARHVEENAAAATIALCEDEVRRIDASFPVGPWRGRATS